MKGTRWDRLVSLDEQEAYVIPAGCGFVDLPGSDFKLQILSGGNWITLEREVETCSYFSDGKNVRINNEGSHRDMALFSSL